MKMSRENMCVAETAFSSTQAIIDCKRCPLAATITLNIPEGTIPKENDIYVAERDFMEKNCKYIAELKVSTPRPVHPYTVTEEKPRIQD